LRLQVNHMRLSSLMPLRKGQVKQNFVGRGTGQ
jgi:hypothetical protein